VRENEGIVVIGTDPAQWTEGRERWMAAREAVVQAMEGLRFELPHSTTSRERMSGHEASRGQTGGRSR
jgi:hypothetical protein